MGTDGNGTGRTDGRHAAKAEPGTRQGTPRVARRVVLLAGDEHSEVEGVLAEYRGADVSGRRLHADVRRFAAELPGRVVAGEWLGALGWTRFLWCRK
jgi:hypothetical protein